MYKSGPVGNPASPDGIIYEPLMRENPFGIFEAKCPFCGVGKKIIDVITENKQFYSQQTDNCIYLKENHTYYYQCASLGLNGVIFVFGVDFLQQELCLIKHCGTICFPN